MKTTAQDAAKRTTHKGERVLSWFELSELRRSSFEGGVRLLAELAAEPFTFSQGRSTSVEGRPWQAAYAAAHDAAYDALEDDEMLEARDSALAAADAAEEEAGWTLAAGFEADEARAEAHEAFYQAVFERAQRAAAKAARQAAREMWSGRGREVPRPARVVPQRIVPRSASRPRAARRRRASASPSRGSPSSSSSDGEPHHLAASGVAA